MTQRPNYNFSLDITSRMFPAATFKVWSPTSGRMSDGSGPESGVIRDEIANPLTTQEIAFGHQDMSVSFHDRAMVRKTINKRWRGFNVERRHVDKKQ